MCVGFTQPVFTIDCNSIMFWLLNINKMIFLNFASLKALSFLFENIQIK